MRWIIILLLALATIALGANTRGETASPTSEQTQNRCYPCRTFFPLVYIPAATDRDH